MEVTPHTYTFTPLGTLSFSKYVASGLLVSCQADLTCHAQTQAGSVTTRVLFPLASFLDPAFLFQALLHKNCHSLGALDPSLTGHQHSLETMSFCPEAREFSHTMTTADL